MRSFKVLATSFFLGLAVASPLPDLPMATSHELSDLQARDFTCFSPQNTAWNAEVYNCPHKNTMASNGQCQNGMTQGLNGASWCSAYCEVRNYWFPGPESPFANSACEAGDTCSLAQAKATAITNGFSLNLGFTANSPKVADDAATASFNAGASYSYSYAVTYTTTETHNRPANATSECGYWTFVPYYIASCGSISFADYNEGSAIGAYGQGCGSVTSTTGNWCNSSPYKAGGQAQGVVVFVNTDCSTGALLPMNQQDTIYAYPGVSTGKH